MTRWKTSCLTTDLNILLICHSQPCRQVGATVNGCFRKAWRKKKKEMAQTDTTAMINVTPHPAVNIRECCSFWEMIIDVSDAGKALWWTSRVFSLMYDPLGEKRPNWGLKTRISRWWETWHLDLENGCKINIRETVPILTQEQIVSLYFFKTLSLALQRVVKIVETPTQDMNIK